MIATGRIRRSVPVLGSTRTVNYATQTGLDFYDYAVQVGYDTGRRVFGQLWMPDPNIDELLYVCYAPSIAVELNKPNALLRFMESQ